MILLFEEKEQNFDNNGLGSLADAITCEVTEELNGKYELEMTYPTDGIHYSDITLDKFIYCKPNSYDQMQPFRIYSISKPINKIVTINAEHISYDLSGVTVRGALEHYAWYANEVFDHIDNNKIMSHPFTFSTNVTRKGEINLSKPRSARSFLGTDEGILSAFGGEYEFDMYSVIHREKRGEDRGVCIEYGKNLTDLKQEENNNAMFTAVYPYYYVEDDGLQRLDDDVVRIIENPAREKVLTLDLTSEFEEMPTQEQLREATRKYIEDNKLNEPTVSLTVSFIKNEDVIESLQDVRLGDTVTVRFLKLGIDSNSRCISYKYNAITEHYNSIDLGEPPETLVETVNKMSQKQTSTEEAIIENSYQISSEVERATEAENTITVNLEQTANSIRSEVSDTKNGLETKITQTASAIRQEVSTADEAIKASLNLKIDKTDDAQIISMIEGSANRINFNASNMFTVTSPNFSVDANGYVTMKNADIAGTLNATSGSIGQFEITDDGLVSRSYYKTKLAYNYIETAIVDTAVIYNQSYGSGIDINSDIEFNNDANFDGSVYINRPGSSSAEANTCIQGSGLLSTTSSSSKRYKHDIVPVQNYELDPHRLYNVGVMQYKYNLDHIDALDQRYDTDVIGFIAEDIYEKYPIAAEISPTGTIENWNTRYMIPPMLKLIQEQHEEIEQMKFDNMTLRCEIDLLKQKEA